MSNPLELKYSASLMSQSFWFVEFRNLVKLAASGIPIDEIKKKCLEENLVGALTENRIKRATGYLINRLKQMDEKMIKIFCDADVATQKIINLVIMLRMDRLFFEFMYEVYRDKVILGIPELSSSDVNVFFSKKEIQSEEVAGWKDTTRRKLGVCYLNYLADANLLTVIDKKKMITPPVLDIVLERYLQASGDEAISKAITGDN